MKKVNKNVNINEAFDNHNEFKVGDKVIVYDTIPYDRKRNRNGSIKIVTSVHSTAYSVKLNEPSDLYWASSELRRMIKDTKIARKMNKNRILDTINGYLILENKFTKSE